MCGLVLLAFERRPRWHSRLPAALDCIAHRGPDGADAWFDDGIWMGFRRLAIIDLNPRANQPMLDAEDGDLVMVFNGEIFNYRELRVELEAVGVCFTTEGDSEVLLKAYRTWGAAAFERMNGMWAVAIWDRRKQTLFLCRDRYGVKPLYYARIGNGIAVASEPKSLLAIEPSLAEPSREAISRLVINSEAFSGQSTFFSQIHSVPPACWALIGSDRRVEFARFWSYPEAEPDRRVGNEEQDAEEFAELFHSAVALRLRSDVPVGLTLSGGLDSTAILAASRGEIGNLTAFTAAFGEGDERNWARSAAEHAGVRLCEVEAEAGDWIERLRQITWHMDAPGFSPPVFPLWNIMAAARREGVPVLLEGQGADELLGGYVQYGAAHLLGLLAGGQVVSAARKTTRLAGTFGWVLLAKWASRLAVGRRYRHWQKTSGRGTILIDAPEEFVDFEPCARPHDPFGLMQEEHSSSVLPSLLHYGDAVSMAHGVESRVPFLDYRLVEWVFRKRPELFADGWSKAPLRAYLDAQGYPRHARRLDKKGFTTPTHRWIKNNRTWIDDVLLNDPNALLWQYVRRDRAAEMLDPDDYFAASHAYKLITLQLWLQIAQEWRTAPPAEPSRVGGILC
jgi:asparagine synthase (glutamine-hydrolysing)